MVDSVWKIWADDIGADTRLSAILRFADCFMILANPWCEPAFVETRGWKSTVSPDRLEATGRWASASGRLFSLGWACSHRSCCADEPVQRGVARCVDGTVLR